MIELIINGRFLLQPLTGVQRYAIEVVKAFDRILADEELGGRLSLTLLAPRSAPYLNLGRIKELRVGYTKGYTWEQLELPLLAGKGILLNLCNLGPLCRSRQWVVIHDAAVHRTPEAYGRLYGTWHRLASRQLARASLGIATVSDFSRAELAEVLGLEAASIPVTLAGSEHIEHVVADERIFGRAGVSPGEYALAVGSRNPNKNFSLIAQALAKLPDRPFRIVLAGGGYNRPFSASAGRLDGIVETGYVTDGELKALLSGACCFIFPSRYEGFGLPPLEAMRVGCPVLCSDRASLPEVCGEAALYFDADNALDLAHKLERVMADQALRRQLSQNGRDRAQDFSWDIAARRLLSAVIDRRIFSA